MGTWGAGLYSGDAAQDLRGTIAAMSRLPFDGDAILAELRRHDQSADDPDDESHTVFWLVTADQFAKRGIACEEAKSRALEIITSGRDIALMKELGLAPGGLRSRQKMLSALAGFLRNPEVKIRRKILKAPEPLLMQANTAWRFPANEGKPRNPYFATAEAAGFVADGWGGMLVLDTGRVFDWLAWYIVAPLHWGREGKPELEHVPEARLYTRRGYEWDETAQEYVMPTFIAGGAGTLTRTRSKRMELECMGEVRVGSKHIPDKLRDLVRSAAVNDICISARLSIDLCEPNSPKVAEWLAT